MRFYFNVSSLLNSKRINVHSTTNTMTMGNNENILVVGRHQFIMDKVLNTLRQQHYNAVGVLTDNEAVDSIQTQEFDAVIFGGGVELDSSEFIKIEAKRANKNLKFVYARPQSILEDLIQVLNN